MAARAAAGRLAAGVGAGWLLVAAVPATRPVLDDKRITGLDGRAVAYQAVVRIPVGTVLWEETAFRGVLQAALRRVLPEPAAIVVTAGVFGVWHIRPTLGALRANGLAADRSQAVARVSAALRGDGRGRRAAVLAAGSFGQPGRAGAGASGQQQRRPGRCLGGRLAVIIPPSRAISRSG